MVDSKWGDAHGYCMDCGKQMSDKWMYNNPFAQEGSAPSCPMCGGVVGIMYEQKAAEQIAKSQRQRGINKEARPSLKKGETFEIDPVPMGDEEDE